MTNCLQQSEYDDVQANVSRFFTFAKVGTAGIRGKWLNLRNLVGDGTPLATTMDEARGIVMYFTARARSPNEIHP